MEVKRAVSRRLEMNFDEFRASYLNAPGYSSVNMNHYHAHETYEIFYLCNGERYYFINGQNHYVKRGELVLINRNVIHKTTTSNVPDYERIALQVPHEFLVSNRLNDLDLTKCFNYSSPVVSLPKKERAIIESLFFNVLDELKDQNMGYKSVIQAHITQALIYIHRHALSANHQLLQETYVHKKINDVVSYIGNNYMVDVTLPELANHFHISKSHLSRTFKKVTGLTIIEYLNSVRINHAQKMLRNSKISISKISSDTGFNNVSHFDRTFKKITGYSPTHFRRIQQGKYPINKEVKNKK